MILIAKHVQIQRVIAHLVKMENIYQRENAYNVILIAKHVKLQQLIAQIVMTDII